MRCPQCDAWVLPPLIECPGCGLDVSMLRSVQDVKDGVQRIKERFSLTVDQLNDLQRSLDGLRGQVENLQRRRETPPLQSKAAISPPDSPAPKTPPTSFTPKSEPPRDDRESEAPAPIEPTHVSPRPLVSRDYSAARGWAVTSEQEIRLGQKWLLVVGLFISLLGIGYFLKYAFDQNWIQPPFRVVLAFATGALCMAGGEFARRRKLVMFGLYLIGGGIAVLYCASYAAFQIYELVSQTRAFGLMIVVTLLAGGLSIRYDTQWLAVLGIIGGFLTPVVLSTGTDRQIGLMTYMSVLNVGILSIAVFKAWRLLNGLGFAFTWLLFSAWYFRYYEREKFWPTVVFLNLFFLIHAIAPFLTHFVRTAPQRVRGFAVTIPNAAIALAFSYPTIATYFSRQAVSVTTVSYAAFFLFMAGFLRLKYRESQAAFTLLLGKAIVFLVLTVPLLFSRQWITVFWAIQGVALIGAGVRVASVNLRHSGAALLIFAVGRFLLHDYLFVFGLHWAKLFFPRAYQLEAVGRWITTIIALGAVLTAARLFRRSATNGDGLSDRSWSNFFHGAFGLLLLFALTVEVSAHFYEHAPTARFAAISILWASFSIGTMLLGFLRNVVTLRHSAIALFAVVILKIFLLDMRNVRTPYRIASFLGVGVMLVGASFLYHRFKERILGSRGTSPRNEPIDGPSS